MKLITLKTFDNAIEAHNLKNRLEVEDIKAYIFDEHLIGLNPLYSNAIGGIKVNIAESDTEQALSILQSIENLEYLIDKNDSLHCPNCDSIELYTNFKDFKNITGILSLIISIVFFVYPIYFKHRFKCKECGLVFKKS